MHKSTSISKEENQIVVSILNQITEAANNRWGKNNFFFSLLARESMLYYLHEQEVKDII
jgi:hypothetical protein